MKNTFQLSSAPTREQVRAFYQAKDSLLCDFNRIVGFSMIPAKFVVANEVNFSVGGMTSTGYYPVDFELSDLPPQDSIPQLLAWRSTLDGTEQEFSRLDYTTDGERPFPTIAVESIHVASMTDVLGIISERLRSVAT